MKISLADLHCDTPYEMYKKNQPLRSGNLHISLDKAAGYDNYLQIMAVWSDKQLGDDEAYREFFKITDNLKSEIEANSDRAAFCKNFADIEAAWSSGRAAILLAAEDARLLGGKLGRLDALHAAGVRFLTFCWSGLNCIGMAWNGSQDSAAGENDGLTEFGRSVLLRCFELGIIPDISHASDATAAEMLDIARAHGKPVTATHSNARAVHPHTRNLTDGLFKSVFESGGVAGINMYTEHLGAGADSGTDAVGIDAVGRHIAHYLSLGGADAVCLGCDMDGADMPGDIADVSRLGVLADRLMAGGCSPEIIGGVFWRNAYEFLRRNL